ncbi:MAG: hypothetical protein LBS55_13285 [Prevotellaceae bacterium]|jgi:hypothetical protein|nr:hypothetical protein [Prevotellaceae bacterium]
MKEKEKAAITAAPAEPRHKDNHFAPQYEAVYKSFKERPKTMLQASIETGILRANICRYIADMEEKGYIQVIRKGRCPYTRFRAGFYSTDEALFTKSHVVQLNLFDDVV